MTTQAVADLCWAINTPSLIEGEDVMPCPEITPGDIDADHLERFIDQRQGSYRVGRYFETLIEYWLRHVRKLDVTARGMQLRDGKITVGEIDFLYRDEQDALVHCETTVKFFLCVPGHSPSEFPGPNANDNYESKLTKLFEDQLVRSERFIPEVELRLGIMKGMLFYRAGNPTADVPPRLSPAHQRGAWLRVDEIESLGGDAFAIATKPNWLAPVVDADVMSRDEVGRALESHFEKSDQPIMLSSRDATDVRTEVQRLFVVSPTWPLTGAPA